MSYLIDFMTTSEDTFAFELLIIIPFYMLSETKVQKIKCKKIFSSSYKRGYSGIKIHIGHQSPYIPYELAIKHKDPEPS